MPKRSSWVLHKILSTKKQASSNLEGEGGRDKEILFSNRKYKFHCTYVQQRNTGNKAYVQQNRQCLIK